MPPDSNHPTGVNAARADGSVDFVSNSIYAGNLAAPGGAVGGPSPYGVWGALGSKDGGDRTVRIESSSRVHAGQKLVLQLRAEA